MKISISELEPQKAIRDLDCAVAEIVKGGGTEAAIYTESFATGDFTITQSDANVYTFTYEDDNAEYSLSFGLGYTFGFSAEAKV